jgi:hypothetical protein
MDSTFMISVCLFLIASTIAFLSLGTKQRDIILKLVPLPRRRRNPLASTPPRSVTPEKKGPETPPPNYKDVFPPSRRASLAVIPSTVQKKLSISTSSSQERPSTIVPLASPIEDLASPAFTATEFSTEEIKALGDFPDYAELSGVPLPKPYSEFVIEKASPRPYRPFRWAYHQTMCRFLLYMVSRSSRLLIHCYSTRENGAELVVGARKYLRCPDCTTQRVF